MSKLLSREGRQEDRKKEEFCMQIFTLRELRINPIPDND